VRSRVTGAEPAVGLGADEVNKAAEAAPGAAAPLPDEGGPESIVPPAEDPELGAGRAVFAPPSGTADVDVLGSTVVPTTADVVVTLGSVVVVLGSEVVTGSVGTVVVTFGIVLVIFGIVVVICGIVVVTFGSVVVTGSVVEIVGSAVVIVSCGTADRPRIGAVAKKPSRRIAARAAARLIRSAYPDPPAHNPEPCRACQRRISTRAAAAKSTAMTGKAARRSWP
jgi:hypothetical protein